MPRSIFATLLGDNEYFQDIPTEDLPFDYSIGYSNGFFDFENVNKAYVFDRESNTGELNKRFVQFAGVNYSFRAQFKPFAFRTWGKIPTPFSFRFRRTFQCLPCNASPIDQRLEYLVG